MQNSGPGGHFQVEFLLLSALFTAHSQGQVYLAWGQDKLQRMGHFWLGKLQLGPEEPLSPSTLHPLIPAKGAEAQADSVSRPSLGGLSTAHRLQRGDAGHRGERSVPFPLLCALIKCFHFPPSSPHRPSCDKALIPSHRRRKPAGGLQLSLCGTRRMAY